MAGVTNGNASGGNMKKITRRQTLKLAGAALAAPALTGIAHAQAWPARNIRAMVPFGAGSSIDIVGRIVLDPLSKQLGQTIVSRTEAGPAAR
jgi:tripartite-type tricarboxylate transporter receptor subunit TctC